MRLKLSQLSLAGEIAYVEFLVCCGAGGAKSFSCQTQLLICWVEFICGLVGIVTKMILVAVGKQGYSPSKRPGNGI